MRGLVGTIPGALAIALSASGCFAIVDVDRFHSSDAGPETSLTTVRNPFGAYLDLRLSLIGMTPHVMQLFEYRIIDSNNVIQSRGVVNPLGAADVVINAPLSIPKENGPFHLDFYADVNGSGGYDGIGSVITNDHAWRIEPLDNYPHDSVTPVDGLIQVIFTHNTSFTDINTYPSGTPNIPKDIGLGATIHVGNANALVGDLIQVRIVDTGSNRTVGLVRLPKIAQGSFDLKIPGLVEPGGAYNALAYVDANGNGAYDNPATGSGDLGWSVPGTADTTGLNVTVDAQATNTGNVDVGAP
jgi:hypothetical protein